MAESPKTDGGKARVVIGASDAPMRAGLRLALSSGDMHVCALAASVQALVPAVQRHRPHVCLVDAELEGDWLQAIAEISVRSPSVAVVALDTQATEERFLEVMRLGAAGYLEKTIAPAALASAVKSVVNGEPAVPRALVRCLIDGYRDRPMRRSLAVSTGDIELTSRECQVLDFIQAGLSTREIAARLVISEVTVRRHVSAVLKKLQVQSRAEAIELLHSA